MAVSPHGSEVAADVISCLVEGPDLACQQPSLLSSVCSVYSRHYGFSYIIMLRPHARITHSLKVIALHRGDTERRTDEGREKVSITVH